MVILRDDRGQVSNLRKQILGIKGKLFVEFNVLVRNVPRVIIGQSSPTVFSRDIDIKRALSSASMNAKYIGASRYMTSDVKIINISNWGIRYSNKNVTVKRVNVKGKYRNMVWVKGRRGVVINTKFRKNNKTTDKLNDDLEEL